MKSKSKVIVIFLSILCVFAFLCFCLAPNNVTAEKISTKSEQIVNSDAINIYLSKTDIDKTAGSKGELKTATYLSDFLRTQGCEHFNNLESYFQEFTIGYGQISNNVIGVKKSIIETKTSILIGAHYDNSYSKNKSIGAINNASGVVTLMALIEKLKTYEFEFNIIYCFFGAGELDLLGSKAFVNSLNREMKKNLLLSINLDSIGCGENTYYYAGDSANSFVKTFNFENYHIAKIPTYAKTKFIFTKESLAYSNQGLSGDNVPFLSNKIKSISFFGGNFNSLNAGFKESENNENIAGSSLDTPSNLIEYYPEHMNKINDVANLIFDAINNPNLVKNLTESYHQIDFSFLNNKIMVLALGIFGVLLLCGIKTKNAKAEIEEENK